MIFGFVTHKILHGLKGFGEGAIIGAASDNKAEILGKAIAGATGAFVAETTADILTPTGGLGNNAYDPVRIRQTQAAARAVTAAIAFAMGMSADDIGMAVFSANTSLDHNFGATAGGYLSAKENINYQNMSPQEQEAFKAVTQTVAQRYLDCLDAGMTHEQAQACVQADLDKIIDESQNPRLQKTSLGAAVKGLEVLYQGGSALFKAAMAAKAHLKDILTLARTGITLDQLFKDKSNGAKGTTSHVGENSARGTAGGGMPDPEHDPDKTQREKQVKIPGLSGKEGAKDPPSWAKGEAPYVGEKGEKFADRLLTAKYGQGNYKRGPNTEHNIIRKWADRSFKNPK